MATTVPEYIGKYRILGVVGKGGMGTVFKAMHPSLRREVIIKKQILRGNPMLRERFKREAQVLLDLNSQYVVRVYDYFTEGRSDYIVMELVDGIALDKLLEKQKTLPAPVALLVFREVCYGLLAAHRKSIVHRDIKPANVLISKSALTKLADFGIAGTEKGKDEPEPEPTKAATSHTASTMALDKGLTLAGTMIGTPSYMSPEQFDDSSSVDVRADIYSMGVMLYEMVTGQKPYAGDMKLDTIEKIRRGKYTPPEKLNKTLPHVVRSIIKKMMQPNRERRYQSIEPVIARINRYLDNFDIHELKTDLARSIALARATPARPAYAFPAHVPRNKKIIRRAVVVGTVAAAIALVAFGWWQGFFHRTVLRPWYTPVTLSLEVPRTSSADADLPARAFFFENDNSSIPEVTGSRRAFKTPRKAATEDGTLRMQTKPVYLKPGDYRVKIAEGPYIWWKSITVGSESLDIALDFLKDARRSLTVHVAAQDAETGKDITAKCQFLVEVGSDRKNLLALNPAELTTGAVYRVHVIADGYRPEYFGLLVDWYQDELFINASLHNE